jgi:ubiquitin conjugation factor E4 B
MGDASAVALRVDNIDRIIVARLIESAPAEYPQPPLQYLFGCYSRLVDEARTRQVSDKPGLLAALSDCRALLVSYTGLVLAGGIIPHVGKVVGAGFLSCKQMI